MTDESDGKTMKEPPKIKLGIPADAPAAPENKAPETPAPEATPPPKPVIKLNKPVDAPAPPAPAAPAEGIQEESLEDLYKEALNATQRVILDEKDRAAAGAPTPAQTLKKVEIAEAEKKATARLDLQEMLSDEEQSDLLKNQTMHINVEGEPTNEKPAGTIKINRPESASEPRSSETIPIPLDLEESKKSETARIELPREVTSSAPPSQRKTIRIKRPDAAGGSMAAKPLAVARATPSNRPVTASSDNALVMDDDEDRFHPIFSIAAVLALIVGLALVYVLFATYNPELPMTGRL